MPWPRSLPIARTPGPNQSRNGDLVRKSILPSYLGSRGNPCLSRLPTKPTMPKQYSLTIASWASRSGSGSTAARRAHAGTTALWPTCSPKQCPDDCRTVSRALWRSSPFERSINAENQNHPFAEISAKRGARGIWSESQHVTDISRSALLSQPPDEKTGSGVDMARGLILACRYSYVAGYGQSSKWQKSKKCLVYWRARRDSNP